jgi:hypothetical protein
MMGRQADRQTDERMKVFLGNLSRTATELVKFIKIE